MFDPSNCHNEREVESKLLVSYLLPALGYSTNAWRQELKCNRFRLDFLAASNENLDPKHSIVLEAKHPDRNLNDHVNPLILLRTGIESFSLIEGNLEYYAAIRAREIDPFKGETINAYIVESEAEADVYNKQIEIFRQTVETTTTTTPTNNVNLENRLTALEKIVTQLSEQIQLLSEQIGNLKALPAEPKVTAADAIDEQKFIEEINTLPIVELASKLAKAKATKKVRENIIKAREDASFEAYKSSDELVEKIAGLGKVSLEKILKNWF